MRAKAPIFTRSLWSFRSFSWGDHSDHSAGAFAQIIIQLPKAEARHRAQFEFEDETPLVKTRKLKSSSFVGTESTHSKTLISVNY